MRKIILAAALMAFGSVAQAHEAPRRDSVHLHTGCSHGYGGTSCDTTLSYGSDGPTMTEAEYQAKLVEDKKWEDYCQPAGHRDEYGVVRLSYSHTGCEFGRSSE